VEQLEFKKKRNVDVNLAVIKVFSETREQEKNIANLKPLYSISKKIIVYNKHCSSTESSLADSIIRVKINANYYLLSTDNFIVLSPTNTL
jgi:hypothetical protein